KGRDENSIHVSQAAKIGYFRRRFRLRGKKNTIGHMAYDRQLAINCLSAYVPHNPPNCQQPPSQSSRELELARNNALLEGTEATEGFEFQSAEEDNAYHDPSGGQELSFCNSASRAIVAVLPTDEAASSTKDEKSLKPKQKEKCAG